MIPGAAGRGEKREAARRWHRWRCRSADRQKARLHQRQAVRRLPQLRRQWRRGRHETLVAEVPAARDAAYWRRRRADICGTQRKARPGPTA